MDEINSLAQNNNPVKKRIEKIAFLGGAAWKGDDEAYIAAMNTAEILAYNGYKIVNGGGPGVMEASTKGAHKGGGYALAITYHPNKKKRHYEGVANDNDFDDEIITLNYFDRTKVMLENTDVHIVFNGSLGTMSELAMTWILSWIHEPNNKPIILFGEFWQEYIDYLKNQMYLRDEEEKIIRICTTPQEVLNYIEELQKDRV